MCNELKKSDLPWFTRINWHENMPIKIYVIISVPSKVRNCAEPPDYLRSEISFLRTCNFQI